MSLDRPRYQRLGVALACVMATIGRASSSRANGRFPYAQRLLEHPTDPNRLILAGTYGLLATRDRGANWYFICEGSFAQSAGYTGDPLPDFTSDESLIVGVQTSMSLSTDEGCTWASTLAEGNGVVDHALARSDPGTIVAAVVVAHDGGVSNELRESLDNGRTWKPVGVPLPLDSMYTIDVDPTNSDHLYASGIEGDTGMLASSVDRGATWIAHPIPDTGPNAALPYIAGIDPRAPGRILVRTDSGSEIMTRGDALLYSEDGGTSFREIHRSRARLLGFALSPDASTVLIGYGAPGFGVYAPGPLGVFKSSTDQFSFERVYGGHVNGLTWTKTGVYVSAAESQDAFDLAFSPAADFRQEGACLVPLLHVREIKGPLECPQGPTAALCAAEWSNACYQLGACSSVTPKPRACIPFEPPDPNAGSTSGATGSGAGTGGGSGDDAGADDTAGAEASRGCHCRAVRGRRDFDARAVLGLLLAFVARRRHQPEPGC